MNLDDYDAFLFDLDGVLTPTADYHRTAWGQMFDAFLATRPGQEPFSDADYLQFVDGKPRYDGVRSFLQSRGIQLPDGEPEDPPQVETVCGLGNRKNAIFAELLEAGIAPYPASVALLDHLAARGTPMAVVSSSRNATTVLAAAGLADRFDLVVDGLVAAGQGLAGKPAPDTYAFAAGRLNTSADRAVVLEDALSGVESGRNGNFGLVVGVDRGAGRDALLEHGADVVVRELDELIDGPVSQSGTDRSHA